MSSTHHQHDVFVEAVNSTKKVRLTFFGEEDLVKSVKVCAPVDYNPARRAKDKSSLYHFVCFESDNSTYVLSLPPNQILSIEPTEEPFNPAEFISYDVNWFLARHKGPFGRALMFLKRCFNIGPKSNLKKGADRRARPTRRFFGF